MTFVHFSLLILLISTYFFVFKKMDTLRWKINDLPKAQKLSFNFNALVGKNISQMVTLPNNLNEPTLLLIVSPTCSVCHVLLDKAIQKSKSEFICYVNATNKNEYEKFKHEYTDKIDFFPLVNSQLISEFIYIYPFLIWVDQNGFVTKTSYHSNSLVK